MNDVKYFDNDNWEVNEDGDYLNSVNKIKIPWLEIPLEVWVDLEYKEKSFTETQKNSFIDFLSLSNKSNLSFELEKCYNKELKENRIHKVKYDEILETINWQSSQLCIPQHYQSKNKYAILLLETYWQIVDSEFTLELEILFTNGKIELCQEMSGIWCRIEWREHYLKRQIIE